MSQTFDAIIIGGGPGGYVAAIRASQLGFKVALVEKRKTLGGTCLNVGCIPSKALLDCTELYDLAKNRLADFGLKADNVNFDLDAIQKRKDRIVQEVCQGVDFLIKKNKIARYHGTGSLKGNQEVQVGLIDGRSEIIKGKNILIATGSEPVIPSDIELDNESVITSTQALSLSFVPRHLVIIGAGVIGLELGTVWRRLGAKVTFVEMLDDLFGNCDKQIAAAAKRIYEAQGMEFLMGHKLTKIEKLKNEVKVEIEDKNTGKKYLSADKVLLAVGRKPFLEGLGLENAGVELSNEGRIKVNRENYETTARGVFAIGDCTAGPMLAHRASEEGIVWAERLSDQNSKVNYQAIPCIVYTWPEIAWIGMGEQNLKDAGIEYKVGRSYFRANGRAKAMGEEEGLVKILADKHTDKLLGIFIIGPRAQEMIAEAAVLFEYSASAEDVARTIHAHPSVSEVIKEAALAADNRSIHG